MIILTPQTEGNYQFSKAQFFPIRKGSRDLWYPLAIRTKEGFGWNGRLEHPSNFALKVVFKKQILISEYSVTWLSLLGGLGKSPPPYQPTIFSPPPPPSTRKNYPSRLPTTKFLLPSHQRLISPY